MTSLSKITIVVCCTLILSACSFGFKGISIKPEVKSFSVENFALIDQAAPNDLNQTFSEELRLKVRQESRLTENNENPDIIFSGTVSRYRVEFAAPDANNTASLNRLTIEVKIKYENLIDEEDTWEKTYSDFEDYDSNGNLQQLQDGLIDVIVDDILERAFNDAFTDW
jgi:hypothetical protein